MIESAPVGLGIALAPWSGRVRQAPWGKQAPSQAPRRKVLSLGLAHYREAPAGEEKKAEFPQRQRHPAHPTSGPLSGHLPGDPPPQLSLQGQGLPEARGRGLPLPPPRQWGRRRSHRSSLSGPPTGGPYPGSYRWGGSGCEGRGLSSGAGPRGHPGEPFRGGTGRESKGGRLRGTAGGPRAAPVGRTAAAGKGLGGSAAAVGAADWTDRSRRRRSSCSFSAWVRLRWARARPRWKAGRKASRLCSPSSSCSICSWDGRADSFSGAPPETHPLPESLLGTSSPRLGEEPLSSSLGLPVTCRVTGDRCPLLGEDETDSEMGTHLE